MATTPYQQRVTLFQGSDWEGVRFRKLDSNGDPLTLTITAPVSSGPPAVGGEHLTDANVSTADGDGYYTVSLTDTQTAALPIRQVFINITATNGSDTQTVIQVIADVQGTLDTGA